MKADGFIALAAGGTGGHMFPAEALAQELKRRGWKILLATDQRGDKYTAAFPLDEKFLISAASPSIGGPIAKAAAAMSIGTGLLKALGEFRKRDIAAAVGFGGYPSFPAMKAAELLAIPYAIHEQNGVLGRANRMIAHRARFLAHGFPNLEKAPARMSGTLVEIGNPLRDAVRAVASNYPAIDDHGALRVLVFGGSQGASLFSRVVPPAIAALPAELRARLHVTQQARESEAAAVEKIYADAGVRSEIAPFYADLPARMAASHLIIARAGASTVTELSAIGRPSVLVPLAIAMDDHQTGNARALGDAGAAVIIKESDFSAETLASKLHDLLSDAGLLRHMAGAARSRVKSRAAEKLADLVEEIASAKSRAAA